MHLRGSAWVASCTIGSAGQAYRVSTRSLPWVLSRVGDRKGRPMLHETTVRLKISLVIMGAGLLLYWLTNRVILAHSAGKVHDLISYQRGSLAILYFTTPDCAPCKTVQ